MSEKTEKPTPRRLREARKKGDVPRSMELTRAFVLVGCLVWLGFGMGALMQRLLHLLKTAVNQGAAASRPVEAAIGLLEPHLAWLLLPPLVFALAFSLLGDFLQVRGVFSLHPLLPRMERLNPAEGLKRIFSTRSLVMLGFALAKLVLIVAAAVLLLKHSLHELTALIDRPVGQAAHTAAWLLLKLLALGAVIHLIVAVLDLAFQHYDYLKRQRMSIEELRREHKDTEGDPFLRARRRVIARSD